MSRTPIIAANWKMNKGPKEAKEFLAALKDELTCECKAVDKVIVPPFVTIPAVMETLNGCTCIGVGAQDVSDRDNGAFTGEISTAMLNELGCKYVVLGHSERRQYHGETNAYINKKIKKALAAGICPIYCIGETLEQRQGGELEAVLKSQVVEGLEGLTAEEVAGLVIAYEPVWAIGTGVTASSADAQDAHAFIRGVVAEAFGAAAAEAVRLQYGGSVKQLVYTVEMDYPAFHLQMQCFACRLRSGTLQLHEHTDSRWLAADELDSVRWLPADVDVLPHLRALLAE